MLKYLVTCNLVHIRVWNWQKLTLGRDLHARLRLRLSQMQDLYCHLIFLPRSRGSLPWLALINFQVLLLTWERFNACRRWSATRAGPEKSASPPEPLNAKRPGKRASSAGCFQIRTRKLVHFNCEFRMIFIIRLLSQALEMAANMARLSPVAVQGTKYSLIYGRDHSALDGLNTMVRESWVKLVFFHAISSFLKGRWNGAISQTEDFENLIKAMTKKERAEFQKYWFPKSVLRVLYVKYHLNNSF